MYNCKKTPASGIFLLLAAALAAQTPFFTRVRFDSTTNWLSPSTLRATPGGHLLLSVAQSVPCLLEFDANGALLRGWRPAAAGGEIVQLADAWELPGKDKICLVGIQDSINTPINASHYYLKRYTDDFQELWSVCLGTGNDAGVPQNFRLLPDQAGHVYVQLGNHFPSRLVKCSLAGDVLWVREFAGAIDNAAILANGNIVSSLFDNYNVANRQLILMSAGGDLLRALELNNLNAVSSLQFNPLPGGDLIANWYRNTDGRWEFARLNAGLDVLRNWSMPNAGFQQTENLVVAGDSLCYALGFEGNGTIVFRLDGMGTVNKAVFLPELLALSQLSAEPTPFGDRGLAMAAVGTYNTRAIHVVHLDSSLALPSCPPYPYTCVSSTPGTLTLLPATVPVKDTMLTPRVQAFQWSPFSPEAQAYCPVFQLPNAQFYLPDTVCAGARLYPDSLKNENALSQHWKNAGPNGTYPDPAPQPSFYFYEPGKWTVSQHITYFGCQEDDFSRAVTVLPRPDIQLGADTTLCDGGTFVLNAGVAQATAWSWDDGSMALARPVNQSGLYILTASNASCQHADTIRINFAHADARFGAPDSLCTGAVFQPVPLAPAHAHRWWLSASANTVSTLASPEIMPGPAGLYQILHEVETGGCRDTAAHTLQVLEYPQVRLPTDTVFCTDSLLVLRPDTASISSFFWQDGYPGLDRHIDAGGLYTLVAGNGACFDTVSVVVEARNCTPPQTYAPNTFAPESPVGNAVFQLFHNGGVARIEQLDVFDRWGNLVFSGSGDAGWDGLFRGRPAGAGVYAWSAKLLLASGEPQVLSGTVTLLRQ